jgi:hypothetical protein
MNSYNCRSAASNSFAHKLDGMCFRISIGISESEETKGNGTVLNIWDMCTTQPEKAAGIAVHRPYTYLLSYYVLSKIWENIVVLHKQSLIQVLLLHGPVTEENG